MRDDATRDTAKTVFTGLACLARPGVPGVRTDKETGMATIAVGLCNVDEVMQAIREEAERIGVASRACRITPALIGVQESDLLRLARRSRGDVHYDGRRLWIHGVDYVVRH